MSEVKWIKIETGIFDNKKIKMLEAMPDGDTLIVIWLKILILAGNTNDCGYAYFTKEIPYTEQMLATLFNRPLTTIQLALTTFERYGMIEIIDDIIKVSNWERYQNVEGMERIREQTRKRVAKHRELKRIGCNVTSNATVTQSNAIDIDIDKDIEIEKKEKKEKKSAYGEYAHVKLTLTEYQRLVSDYGQEKTEKAIKFFDEYIEDKGYKSKSHNMAMRRWVFNAVDEQEQKRAKAPTNKFNSMMQNSYTHDEMSELERRLLDN